MFVEVKGPKDKLSERQHSWLIKLMNFGANVEVCNVVGWFFILYLYFYHFDFIQEYIYIYINF